jgi:hypothetical protein
MLNAVGRALAVLGLVGAALALWQLAGWWQSGARPEAAEVWRHLGPTGDFLVGFVAALPTVLAVAVLLQLLVAWLGVGLLGRRPWALRAGRGFAFLWIVATLAAWLLASRALADLASRSPERAAFAGAALRLAGEAAVLNTLMGGAFLALLLAPAVRRAFSAGS